jgi:hypothetical protein
MRDPSLVAEYLATFRRAGRTDAAGTGDAGHPGV